MTPSSLSTSSGPTTTLVTAPGSGGTGDEGRQARGPPQPGPPIPRRLAAGPPFRCAITHLESISSPLAVSHQGQFPVVTISFNLAPNASLGAATDAIEKAGKEIGMPISVQSAFQGTAASFEASLRSEPLLILAALVTVYIVLGVLYESYIHPLTILSTLPSAGVGAILALMICRQELSVVALIGIILLIGIVQKNGIMMIDFALEAERVQHKSPVDAIYEACLAALPSHHHDHHGRVAWRSSAGIGFRHWF